MRTILLVVIGSLLMLLAAAPASADGANFGIRGGYYTDSEKPFLGAEFLAKISHDVWFNPNVEYVFVEDGRLITLNADAHYDFYDRGRTFAYVGAGLAVISSHSDFFDDTSNDVGLNVLGGLAHKTGDVIVYVQPKFIFADANEFVIGAGIRF